MSACCSEFPHCEHEQSNRPTLSEKMQDFKSKQIEGGHIRGSVVPHILMDEWIEEAKELEEGRSC